jgi:phosphotransferase system HPr-like phosphotransfer protein
MADAKSSLAVMSLGVEDGTEIVIQSSDQDAVDSLVEVVESDFERAE